LRSGTETAGYRRRAILKERSNHVAGRRELQRRKEAREYGVDIRPRHGELGRTQVVHRMAEGIHAIAVDVRHGAGAAELKIAGDECDADRIARLERSFER